MFFWVAHFTKSTHSAIWITQFKSSLAKFLTVLSGLCCFAFRAEQSNFLGYAHVHLHSHNVVYTCTYSNLQISGWCNTIVYPCTTTECERCFEQHVFQDAPNTDEVHKPGHQSQPRWKQRRAVADAKDANHWHWTDCRGSRWRFLRCDLIRVIVSRFDPCEEWTTPFHPPTHLDNKTLLERGFFHMIVMPLHWIRCCEVAGVSSESIVSCQSFHPRTVVAPSLMYEKSGESNHFHTILRRYSFVKFFQVLPLLRSYQCHHNQWPLPCLHLPTAW